MDFPGEKLLIRMWETLAEKGVGGLLRPIQMRREGEAAVDIKKWEILALADAEKKAADIRAGALRLEDKTYILTHGADTKSAAECSAQLTKDPVALVTAGIVADAIRREVNVGKAILHAEEELKTEHAPVPDKKADADWLHRWRDMAGNVSAAELQRLWGSLLAGEVKEPGTFSYRTLEFVKNLTVEEALRIEKLFPFVINGCVIKKSQDQQDREEQLVAGTDLRFGELLEMQTLGVISGVEGLGLILKVQNKAKDAVRNTFYSFLHAQGVSLKLEAGEAKKIELPVYPLTGLGRQLVSLGKFTAPKEYLQDVTEKLKAGGFSVEQGCVIKNVTGGFSWLKTETAIEAVPANPQAP